LLREVKRNAVALVRERGTGITYPVASVHFHTRRQLRSDELSRRYRKIWVRRVERFLARTWPQHRRNAIIGGDFNGARYHSKNGRRFRQRWWSEMKQRGFRVSVDEVSPFGGVDYIFTRTRIAGAGVDTDYHRDEAVGSSDYYSDHRLRWALLGPWRPAARTTALSSTTVEVAWQSLPSVKRYFIERWEEGTWKRIAHARGGTVRTREPRLEPRTRYRYRLLAWNGAELSNPSRVMTVRTKRDTLAPHTPASPTISPITRPIGLKLRWRRTPDRGGSGGVTYEVWRREVGKDPERVGVVNHPRFVDRNFTTRRTIEYFVVAVDRVGNRSDRSPAATIVPRLGGTTTTTG
jgi:hypothetical protein